MDNIRAHMTAAHDWVESHRAQTLAILVLLAAIIFIIGLTMTWFVSGKSLSTVGKIQTPAKLKIMGPNQTSIEPIEISYDETRGDVKNSDGTVSVRRAFCVKSNNDENKEEAGGQAFELQVANTTNIKGLDIRVYRVTDTTASGKGNVAGLDGAGKKYAWTKASEVTPFYPINAGQTDKSLAKELEQVDPTYQEYKNVQQNARPLYRFHKFEKNDLDGYKDGKANDATNFIIECTWDPGIVTVNGKTVSNVKETDMVYLIARGTSSNQ